LSPDFPPLRTVFRGFFFFLALPNPQSWHLSLPLLKIFLTHQSPFSFLITSWWGGGNLPYGILVVFPMMFVFLFFFAIFFGL